MNINYASSELSPELIEIAGIMNSRFEGMLNKGGAYMAALTTKILSNEVGWEDKAFLEIGV